MDSWVRALVLVSGCWVLGCGPQVSDEDRGTCDAYLECLAQTDADAFEMEIEIYGDNGSCYGNASSDDCQSACQQKLDDLGGVCEATSDTEPGPEPEPDPGGHVNCGELPDEGPTVGPGEPGPLGFPEAACNPRADNSGSAYFCCSDDPAAAGGELPAYVSSGGQGGTPIFSGLNNAMGTSGMCVRTSDLPAGAGLSEPAAESCPVPCNPTWSDTDVDIVCGGDRVCCQTRAIQPEDCVQDEDGLWRPVTGADIFTGLSDWSPVRHETHQDPGGQGCATFAGSTDVADPTFSDCLEQLSVADQRGFCLALGPGQACPGADALDACEQINMGLIPPP